MLSTLMDMNADSKASDVSDTAIAKTILVVYAAGTDTVRPQCPLYLRPSTANTFQQTISTLLSFILAMLLYPEAMRKGQEELDRVVGKNRLPSFEDRPNLPYIEAICAECLRYAFSSLQTSDFQLLSISRWQPALPLGKPGQS